MKTLLTDMKCVWMTSNVVEYKLCDREFDCEHCPFDKVMRNRAKELTQPNHTDLIDPILNYLLKECHYKRYIYLKHHLALRRRSENRYEMEISPIARRLLEDGCSVFSCKADENVRRGQEFMEIVGAWGRVRVKAPLDFKCVYRREDDPFTIGTIEAKPDEVAQVRLTPHAWQKSLIDLSRMLSQLRLTRPNVGMTMQDGGTRLQFLYQYIGADHYLKILHRLFNDTG
ncbi:hypothetical protein K1X84_00080 [bacterium]|nr:hypothetical protein [bacterium]